MRITNSMMIDRMVTNINNGLSKANNYYMQLASNRRIVRLSDDPVGVLSSMNARLNIKNLERYQASVNTARTWVDQTETTLLDMESVLVKIKENLIDAISTKNDEDKKNIGVLVENLEDHLMKDLNATVGDKYIFAGYNTTNAPFERDENGKILYNKIDLSNAAVDTTDEESQRIQFDIGYEISMDVSLTGIDVVGKGEDNMFKILDDLVADLKAGASNDELNTKYTAKIENLRNRIATQQVEIGARQNKLDMMENRYEVDAINYEAIRTGIEDIDQAQTIMKMKLTESVYQQTLAVGARIIQPSLMDFLN